MKHCPPTGCEGSECRQGRDCLDSLWATRRAWGLHQHQGGHNVNTDAGLHIRCDYAEETDPEPTGRLAYVIYAAIVAFALLGWWLSAAYR